MSPELETLDQLSGQNLSLSIIRQLFSDDDHFLRAVLAMLQSGEIRILLGDGIEVPHWQTHDILVSELSEANSEIMLEITSIGAKRIS